MSNDKGKAQQRRQTDGYRIARKLYNMQPEVRAHRAARRAVKRKLGIKTVRRY